MCKWNKHATDAAVLKTCGTWEGKKNWLLPQLVIKWNKCAHWKYSKHQPKWQHSSAQVQQTWHRAVISQTQRSQIQKGARSVGKTPVAPSERCTTSQVADRSGLLWNTLSHQEKQQEKLMQLVCESKWILTCSCSDSTSKWWTPELLLHITHLTAFSSSLFSLPLPPLRLLPQDPLCLIYSQQLLLLVKMEWRQMEQQNTSWEYSTRLFKIQIDELIFLSVWE